MAKVTVNKSLSARVQRRNCAGFKGEGTKGWVKTTSFGDYKDLETNHKDVDIKNNIAKKCKMGIIRTRFINHPGMTKKYVDNHQKITH